MSLAKQIANFTADDSRLSGKSAKRESHLYRLAGTYTDAHGCGIYLEAVDLPVGSPRYYEGDTGFFSEKTFRALSAGRSVRLAIGKDELFDRI